MKKRTQKKNLVSAAIVLIAVAVWFSLDFFKASAQKRDRQVRKITAVAKTYKRFDHGIQAHHKQSCNECHKTPTGFSLSETAINSGGESYRYPDITDYPNHDSCLDCHRQQFFRGARPAICAVCHTKVSPRDKARFAFPVPNQAGEFSIRFPHDVHQNIIAGNEPIIADTKRTDYNNCTICHVAAKARTYDTAPRRPQLVALEMGMVAAPHRERKDAAVGYFKTLPSGHDSCFNCHYSEQKPTRSDCAGCHIPQNNSLADTNVVERLSLKFNHNQPEEIKDDKTKEVIRINYPHDKECTSCHLRITQSADLRTLDPDVPIFTCASKGTGCHSDEIKLEVDRRSKDLIERQANAQHQIQSCSKCHGDFVGSHQVPESHKGIKP